MSNTSALVVYVGNTLWFGAATVTFGGLADSFVARTIKRTSTPNEAHTALAYATRFLGGMNSGFFLLSLLRIRRIFNRKSESGETSDAKDKEYLEAERDILWASSLAHFSQWLGNVSLYLDYLNGGRPDNRLVLTKEVRYIFYMDAFMAIINGLAARNRK